MPNLDRAPLKVGGPADTRVLKIGRTVWEGTVGQWEKTEASSRSPVKILKGLTHRVSAGRH